MATTRLLIITVFGMLAMSACRDKPTCLDCEDADDAADDGIPVPDLPCCGADLMTDNLNCGTCGHECGLSYPGTEYVAGTCNESVCGPGGWTDCVPGPPFENCSDLRSAPPSPTPASPTGAPGSQE